jgi:TRAP-type uncharacterized transport system substrate-binding protein
MSYLSSGTPQITCSGGAGIAQRTQLASIFSRHSEFNGLDVEIVDTAGSEETLKLVDQGAIDVGFVVGAYSPENYANVRQLATIGTAPLHLLVKSELITHSPCDLGVLKNRVVEVGHPGSGSHALATEVLEFCEFKAKDALGNGDYYQVSRGNVELISLARAIRAAEPNRAKELAANLPDAVFLLDPLPSNVAHELIAAADYDIIPLLFRESFRLNGQHVSGDQRRRIDRLLVTQVTIPACAYRAIDPVPSADLPTLGVPIMVVVRANLPSAEAKRLIATIYEGPFAHEMPPADLLASRAQYPLHPAVTAYLQARKPVAMRELVDRLQKALSLFGAFTAGVLAVLGFYRRRKAKSALTYVSEIGQIERLSWEESQPIRDKSPVDDPEHLRELQARLASLKQRIIDDYALGRFTGEPVFSNLMTLVADTRQSLESAHRPTSEPDSLRITPRRVTPPASTRQAAA